MRHAELTRCPSCGAPMQAPPDHSVHHQVECKFCHAQFTLEPDFAPPAPPPPQQFVAPQLVIQLPRVVHAPQVRFNPIGVLVPIVALVGVFGVSAVVAISQGNFGSLTRSFSSDPFPIKCGLNERITLDGKTTNRQDTLIDASQNCKVKIVNSKLKGATIFRAQHNAEITIEKSTLEATGDGIDTGFNAKIRLDSSSVLKSGGTGIRAGANGAVEVLNGSRIEAQGTAVEVDSNPNLSVQNSTIQGKNAYDLGVNARVRLSGAKVIGARKIGINGKVDE